MIITVPTVLPLLAVISYCLGGFTAMQTWGQGTYILAGTAGIMHFVIGITVTLISLTKIKHWV